MDDISKFLNKLGTEKALKINEVLKNIAFGKTDNMDVKKLKGFLNRYRARVGRIRIIYEIEQGKTRIIDVTFRSDNTYKGF